MTRWIAVVVVLWAIATTASDAGSRTRLALDRVDLDLPGRPARVVPADLDGDGRPELAVVVAYSEVEEIGEDRIEDLVQISVVIPALFDRRELRVYRRTSAGYEQVAPPLELPVDVLHLEPGPPGAALVALRDDGLDAIRLVPGEDGGARLLLERVVSGRTVYAGSETFRSGLRVVHDLDGDDSGDVLFPSADGLRVHLWSDGRPGPARPLPDGLPGDGHRFEASRAVRTVPIPEVRDVDGDGVPDLLLVEGSRWHLLRGRGDGTFAPPRDAGRDCHDAGSDLRWEGVEPGRAPWPRRVVTVRDVDGDGRAEVVTRTDLGSDGDGMRAELREAKRPRARYAVHEWNTGFEVVREPAATFDVVGHDLGGAGGGEGFAAGLESFVDLDGDGAVELVTITLDFSLFQAVRVLATRRISVGIEFRVYRRGPDGVFREVPGLDLDEKLKIDLNDLSFGRFAQFAGDFDGDGRQDFVHLGRGREVTIHRGEDGARYPRKPDLTVRLDDEPPGLELVAVDDLDGDGRADLRITRPLPATDPDTSPPVRLELYLSGGTP